MGSLKSCTDLQTLDIEGNGGSEGAAALADGLMFCTNLQPYWFRGCSSSSTS